LALCGAITAGLLKNGISIPSKNLFIGFTVFGLVVTGLVAGGALGFINGYAITKFKVPPFVATLAMLTMACALGHNARWQKLSYSTVSIYIDVQGRAVLSPESAALSGYLI